jgi:hypothetical protein
MRTSTKSPLHSLHKSLLLKSVSLLLGEGEVIIFIEGSVAKTPSPTDDEVPQDACMLHNKK